MDGGYPELAADSSGARQRACGSDTRIAGIPRTRRRVPSLQICPLCIWGKIRISTFSLTSVIDGQCYLELARGGSGGACGLALRAPNAVLRVHYCGRALDHSSCSACTHNHAQTAPCALIAVYLWYFNNSLQHPHTSLFHSVDCIADGLAWM